MEAVLKNLENNITQLESVLFLLFSISFFFKKKNKKK